MVGGSGRDTAPGATVYDDPADLPTAAFGALVAVHVLQHLDRESRFANQAADGVAQVLKEKVHGVDCAEFLAWDAENKSTGLGGAALYSLDYVLLSAPEGR